jgi:hypothetical protein
LIDATSYSNFATADESAVTVEGDFESVAAVAAAIARSTACCTSWQRLGGADISPIIIAAKIVSVLTTLKNLLLLTDVSFEILIPPPIFRPG